VTEHSNVVICKPARIFALRRQSTVESLPRFRHGIVNGSSSPSSSSSGVCCDRSCKFGNMRSSISLAAISFFALRFPFLGTVYQLTGRSGLARLVVAFPFRQPSYSTAACELSPCSLLCQSDRKVAIVHHSLYMLSAPLPPSRLALES